MRDASNKSIEGLYSIRLSLVIQNNHFFKISDMIRELSEHDV